MFLHQLGGFGRKIRSLPGSRWDPSLTLHPVTMLAAFYDKVRCYMITGFTTQTMHIRSKASFSTGKWYWEVRVKDVLTGAGGTTGCGLEKASASGFLGSDSNGIGYWPQGSLFFGGAAIVTGMATIEDNDILMFAWDADIGSLWVGQNGTWHASGDPGAGTGATTTGKSTTGTTWWPSMTPWTSSTETVQYDIVGTGKNTYSVPSGFTYVE